MRCKRQIKKEHLSCVLCFSFTVWAAITVSMLLCGPQCFRGNTTREYSAYVPLKAIFYLNLYCVLISPDSAYTDIFVSLHVNITSDFHFEISEKDLRPRSCLRQGIFLKRDWKNPLFSFANSLGSRKNSGMPGPCSQDHLYGLGDFSGVDLKKCTMWELWVKLYSGQNEIDIPGEQHLRKLWETGPERRWRRSA